MCALINIIRLAENPHRSLMSLSCHTLFTDLYFIAQNSWEYSITPMEKFLMTEESGQHSYYTDIISQIGLEFFSFYNNNNKMNAVPDQALLRRPSFQSVVRHCTTSAHLFLSLHCPRLLVHKAATHFGWLCSLVRGSGRVLLSWWQSDKAV